MNRDLRPPVSPPPEETIRMLQEELAQTNREVMALTLELETRLEQLRAAEERYRRLAENAPDVIYRCELHPNCRITFINPQVLTITGYAPEEFYADADLLLRVVHAEDRQALEEVLRGDRPAGTTVTMRWTHRNGSLIWIEQHHSTVLSGDRVIAVECIARDVTGRKSLEEQLRQSQKMEAIGRLAGGVAHDFNNLLTVITGYSAHALSVLPPAGELHGEIQEISKAADRAAALTRQLLAFSRRQVQTLEVFDMNQVVAEMDRMVRRLLGEDVEVVTVLHPSLAIVQADRGQMEQVIMNLVVNARDAMPEGGKLILETANVELDEAYCETHTGVGPGRYVMLAVSDTGHGMDEATQARLFEPFFTTKPKGSGTGLGLSMVYGIVKQTGGNIWVYSEPGKGTTFKIYLPAATQAAEPVVVTRKATRTAGSETVLVVEDETGVRKLVCAVLKKAGYHVLEAKNGEEALALNDQVLETIDLLITDVVMPKMGGAELAKRLLQRRAGMKVLFTSGYTDNSVLEHGVGGRAPFLQKPFTPGSLAAKVREVLDADESQNP